MRREGGESDSRLRLTTVLPIVVSGFPGPRNSGEVSEVAVDVELSVTDESWEEVDVENDVRDGLIANGGGESVISAVWTFLALMMLCSSSFISNGSRSLSSCRPERATVYLLRGVGLGVLDPRRARASTFGATKGAFARS